MNFLGHVAVAIGCGRDSDEELLGCILPDMVGMAGLSFDKSRLAPGVAAGVACHHATDAAFHAHPAFVAGAAAIRDQLADAEVATGPRRAVGHVGWELLLDGEVARSEEVMRGFRAALAATSGLDRQWAEFGERLGRHHIWVDYQDPFRLARRLVSILSTRPRLALAADDVAAVGDVLRTAQPAVISSASAVIGDVTAAVAA